MKPSEWIQRRINEMIKERENANGKCFTVDIFFIPIITEYLDKYCPEVPEEFDEDKGILLTDGDFNYKKLKS